MTFIEHLLACADARPGSRRGQSAGLPMLSMDATDACYRAQVDILVNGQPAHVLAEIGIAGQTAISSKDTHDPIGINHIESYTHAAFTLGQFFTE